MSSFVKTEKEGLLRDLETKALVSTDNNALKAYKYKKQKAMQIDQIIKEHEELRKEMYEIKSLLLQLVGQNR
jgi:hypothetical protein